MAEGIEIEILPGIGLHDVVREAHQGPSLIEANEVNGAYGNHVGSVSMLDSSTAPELLKVNAFRKLYLNKRSTNRTPVARKLYRHIKAKCRVSAILNCLKGTFPVWQMLRTYNVRADLVNDLVSGLSVGIVQIPSSMAFAMLATLPPICGLYTAFMSALVYFLFGTSRYVSVGTTATVSLIVGTAVENSADMFLDSVQWTNATTNVTIPQETSFESQQHKVATAITLTFLVGLILVILGKLRCGFLTSYMPDPMLGGFLTSAMILVIISQLKVVLGLKITRQKQPFKCFKELIEIGKNITSTNVASLISSTVCFLVLYTVKVCVNERYKDRLLFPVPTELIVLAVGTTISHFANLHGKFQLEIVGKIPSSFPAPKFPPIEKTNSTLIFDSITVALVAYVISVSIAKSLAKKHKQKISSNQEMVAVGASSLMSSLFSGFAVGVSLSRSVVQKSAGGKTQVSSLIGSLVVLLVILFIGPLFFSLPISVLAAIILVAFKGVFTQLQRGKAHWNVSKYDFTIWAVTFVGVLFLGVDIGLCLGILASVLSLVIRTQRSKVLKLGKVSSTNMYLPADKYICEESEPLIKLFYFDGPLYFANAELFVKRFRALVPLGDSAIFGNVDKSMSTNLPNRKICSCCVRLKNSEEDTETALKAHTNDPCDDVTNNRFPGAPIMLNYVIIDCSGIPFIDATGVASLVQLMAEYDETGIKILIAGVRDQLVESIQRSGFWEQLNDQTFVTVRGAEEHAKKTAEVISRELNAE